MYKFARPGTYLIRVSNKDRGQPFVISKVSRQVSMSLGFTFFRSSLSNLLSVAVGRHQSSSLSLRNQLLLLNAREVLTSTIFFPIFHSASRWMRKRANSNSTYCSKTERRLDRPLLESVSVRSDSHTDRRRRSGTFRRRWSRRTRRSSRSCSR
jgi:hypothetical protein